ncbi:hypothetical protein [Vallicoccus soli]|uniref:Apea-like HEPN domain-containing protein n=1 Tax=Vallicoccus soli TaxID=2339232 RepID=A0A3A3YS63_9ACTN|nr:hypothetical protein [Vallicoccus soli]RJK92511.1 hypothetical protein D5H78_18715 [Vallicoccus soli]
MAKRFNFRQRFELAPGGRLPFSEPTVLLFEDDSTSIQLRSLEDKPLSEASMMCILGSGYLSESLARAAGEQWRNGMQKALAGVKLGANFGLRNPNMGGFTDVILEQITRETGIPVYRDSWDIMVFPSEPSPQFSSATASGHIVVGETVLRASVAAAMGGDSLNEVDEVAFDLFTASLRSSHLADVRVVLLVMAVECLIERRQRPQATVKYLTELVERTSRNSALEASEREALSNALRSLAYESTTKGAKTLAQQVNAGSHAEEPTALVAEAFKMRHSLVHGGRRPDLERVRYVGANLEPMVGELIAGPAVAQSVIQARLDLGVRE